MNWNEDLFSIETLQRSHHLEGRCGEMRLVQGRDIYVGRFRKRAAKILLERELILL